MKPTNEQIKDCIMFLKDKEKVSIREIAEYLGLKFGQASNVADVLENNNIISKFEGNTHRDVIADKSFFESEFIFVNIDDFI